MNIIRQRSRYGTAIIHTACIRNKRVVDDNGCWISQAAKNKGYSALILDGKSRSVHRLNSSIQIEN